MNPYPPSTALILLGIMPNPRDLEIARVLGWYRIPLKSAPKVIDVDYLAFYQTAAFGEGHRWRVESFAEVRGHELTTRMELFRDEPEHPRAREEYFRVQIGPLQALPQPVQAGKWKRITFLYTTGELLQTARTLNDLVVRDEDREILWRTLRERALLSGMYRPADLPEIDLDPVLLAMLGDMSKIKETTQPYMVD
jgi:hypothetical protein